MADDWKVGDLALCVDAGPCRCGACVGLPMLLEQGKFYAVTMVGPDWLQFAEQVGPTECWTTDEFVAGPGRFRKIRPDEHEDCEPEFVTLLNRIKRRQDA